MKHLNINDIISHHEKRAEKRRESFNKVLDMCYKMIDKSSKLDNVACFFDVPEFVIGYPLFNLNECIVYVYNNLVRNGFTVNYIFPRILYISWLTPQYVHQVKQLTAPVNVHNGIVDCTGMQKPKTATNTSHVAIQQYNNTTATPAKATRKNSPIRSRRAPKATTPLSGQKTIQSVIVPGTRSIAELKANGRCVLNLS